MEELFNTLFFSPKDFLFQHFIFTWENSVFNIIFNALIYYIRKLLKLLSQKIHLSSLNKTVNPSYDLLKFYMQLYLNILKDLF